MPHTPHNPPHRLLEKYQDKTESVHLARYWAMCEWFDETCGQLLDYLDQRNLSDNTIILYVCDNGWIQRTGSRGFAKRSKRSPYDGGLRTPIMIRWPGHVQPRLDTTHLASSIDLAPTILHACGLKPTDQMQGINLLDDSAVENRQSIYGATYSHDMASMTDPVASLRYRWCIDGNWKLLLPYTENRPHAQTELYHITEDPHEQNNQAEKHPQRVMELAEQIHTSWPLAVVPSK